MLQNYSTVHNHMCIREKDYKLVLNPIIRPTLKLKTLFYMREEIWELSTLLVQLNTLKSVKDTNLKLYDY